MTTGEVSVFIHMAGQFYPRELRTLIEFQTGVEWHYVSGFKESNALHSSSFGRGHLVPLVMHCASQLQQCSARQDKMVILGKISPIFRSFSTYFLSMVPHPLFFCPHVYRIHLFSPIFCLKWYPILVKNSSRVPICSFSTFMFTDSAYVPLIFCLFST